MVPGVGTNAWLRLVLVQTIVLAALQLVAAWRSRSLAILGDVVHVVLDILAYALALAAEHIKAPAVGILGQSVDVASDV